MERKSSSLCLKFCGLPWRLLVIIFLTTLFFAAFLYLSYEGYVDAFLEWVKGIKNWGYLVIVAAFTLLGLPFVPGGYTIFGLAAGFLFQDELIFAILAVTLGTFLGSVLGFWVTRVVLKEWFQKMISKKPKLSIFLRAMESHGFKLVLFTRMAPIPFGVQNGLFSISEISFVSFIVATLIGVTPEIVMLVWTGKTVSSISEIAKGQDLSDGQYAMLGLEVFVCFVLVVAIAIFSRQAMREVNRQQMKENLLSGIDNVEDSTSDSDGFEMTVRITTTDEDLVP